LLAQDSEQPSTDIYKYTGGFDSLPLSLSLESPSVSRATSFSLTTDEGRKTLPLSTEGDMGDTVFLYVGLGGESLLRMFGRGETLSANSTGGEKYKEQKETSIGLTTQRGC
jgi:hypothetical protein